MKNKRNKDYLFLARLINPVVPIVYGAACFYLYSLFQYGGIKRKVPIILGCFLLLVIWILWCYYIKHKYQKTKQKDNSISKKLTVSRLWFFIACLILVSTTLITGVKIYQSGINYNGKLSWFIQDLKNKRQVEFIHNNIYQYKLDGIFKDIGSKVKMPKKLYISSDFKLKFNKDGRIVSFDTYLYGKSEDGETKSFLISYNERKSDKITIYLNGLVNGAFSEKNRLQPLIDTMHGIPLEETVSQWDQEQYGIFYSGFRSWGYNTEGIIYIDEKGNTRQEEHAMNEVVGYTVSVYVPGKEDTLIPARFINEEIDDIPENNERDIENSNDWEVGYNYNEGEETFFINKDLGYQLPIVDAALGSRFYALLKTQDGGRTWETLNQDPYIGRTGVSAGIAFLDEELGFIGMSHSGGSYGELYRTEDGGASFEEVSIPEIQVPLNETKTYNPFDLPHMPYEENGKLLLLVGQGQDGDYKGGCKALYQSEDNGETWEYIKEVPPGEFPPF